MPGPTRIPNSAPKAAYINLIFALAVTAASAWLILESRRSPCGQRAPLTVLAMIAASLLALSFRLLNKVPARGMLCVCIVLAAMTVTADLSFVFLYRAPCRGFERQMLLSDPQH